MEITKNQEKDLIQYFMVKEDMTKESAKKMVNRLNNLPNKFELIEVNT